MPSAPLAELYALALRTLDVHERRASELRARLAPVLAAGGLGTTLLAGPAFEAERAGDRLAAAALVLALTGTRIVWGMLVMLCGLAVAALVG